MKVSRKIFDAHFHVGNWGQREYFGYQITPIIKEHNDYKDCKAYLEKYDITLGLVVPTYLNQQEINFGYNELIVECVEKVENLYGGLWVSPLAEDVDFTRKTIESIENPKIKVLKMSAGTWGKYSFDPAIWNLNFQENIEYILHQAHQKGLVLQFHTGSGNSDPLYIDKFMDHYGKEGTFHFIHMGESTAEILKFVPRFINWVKKGYDVYTDQVMAPTFGPQWLLHELQKLENAVERMLFGTDSPWSSFESEYWKIEGLEIPDRIKEKIFWENAATLYRVKS